MHFLEHVLVTEKLNANNLTVTVTKPSEVDSKSDCMESTQWMSEAEKCANREITTRKLWHTVNSLWRQYSFWPKILFYLYLLSSFQPLNSDGSDSVDSCSVSLCQCNTSHFLYMSTPYFSEQSAWRNPNRRTMAYMIHYTS